MIKKIFFLVFVLLQLTPAFSQKEFWGSNIGSYVVGGDYGVLFKTNFDGTNKVTVHNFDGINGWSSASRLFLASNGRLYGTTQKGGLGDPNVGGNGVLFEYDLILNKYRVVYYFGTAGPTQFIQRPELGLVEGTPGFLYGTTLLRNVYKYDLNLETISNIGQLPPCTGFENPIRGEMIKASNGNIYGSTKYSSTNLLSDPFAGTIFRINPNTNVFTVVYPFPAGYFELGRAVRGQLVEGVPNKLYGTTQGGGLYDNGVLFEYNTLTNTYTKKIDFEINTTDRSPSPLTKGDNGKLYGIMDQGPGTNPQDPTQNFGSLFEYTIATNTFTTLHVFDYQNSPVSNSLLRASNNIYYGVNIRGIFKFDPTNTVNPVTNIEYWGALNFQCGLVSELIEICRKPSYQEILVNTFAPAVGSTFTYNIQNTNATTYAWKKGTTVLPIQTTGILNLPSVTTSDTGIYTCTMTNECGTTVTANLNINVTNLAVETVDDYKSQISLYPNPTKGILNLKFPENLGLKASSYKITNLLGQIMEEKDISTSGKNELTINTTSYANGVYQITLVTDKGNWNGKFVKE